LSKSRQSLRWKIYDTTQTQELTKKLLKKQSNNNNYYHYYNATEYRDIKTSAV